MTMLDRMRRHRSWLKWSLGVVVATFIFLYVPQFLGGSSAPGAATPIATVDGRTISTATFQQAYDQQISQIRQQYGDLNDQVLRQLGVGERIVQQLVSEEAMLREAERLGIRVSDGELRARLLQLPTFQQNGQFIGEGAYRQILANARPPLTPAQFEERFRRSLVAEKLQAAVTGWIRVPDAEVDREFRRRNEKAKLDLALFTADAFTSAVSVSDADVASYFAAHQEDYRVPEKRRVRYLNIDPQALRARMTVTPAEVQARYQQNLQSYTTPEQIRASHILFKTEGKDDAAVKKLAESVLAKVNAGGDFAALARQYSEDEGSKDRGGDLDFFARGAMVKEFEDAAWAMKPGETSGLVKTPYGYHIIRVTDHRDATTRTLEEVRASLEDAIRYDKARAEASQIATSVAADLKTPADLDRVAKERGLTVGDSGLFARDEPLAGLGFAPAVSTAAFSLEQGKVSDMLDTGQGYAFITLAEVQPSAIPKLEDVQSKVKNDLTHARALDLARQKAQALASARTNFTSAARSAGATLKSTDLIARGSTLPEIGVSAAVDDAAFALPEGGVSQPITTQNAIVVAHVQSKQDVAPAAVDAGREALRAEMRQQRAGEFLEAYMAKARSKMKIAYNETALNSLLAAPTAR